MTTQPEALRLADYLEGCDVLDGAAELRRLHEVNQRLLEALKMMGTPSPAVFLPHEIELWQNAIKAAEVKP